LLHIESGRDTRVTTERPSAVDSELKQGSSDAESAARVKAFYDATKSRRIRSRAP
jgi:hypothetical protein